MFGEEIVYDSHLLTQHNETIHNLIHKSDIERSAECYKAKLLKIFTKKEIRTKDKARAKTLKDPYKEIRKAHIPNYQS